MNKAMNQLTILGSGTSTGIPMLGCDCPICSTTDQKPKNKRFRTSVLITTSKGHKIIIDTPPDLRSQLLKNKVDTIDAAIITHEHADHVHGIDDLRPFCFGNPRKEIPVFTNPTTAIDLTARFPYIFQRQQFFSKNKPILG
ncbi:MAG: MBL fold metallo-hydrolase, partial [Bacteriovoracia bacterium]